MLIELTEDQYEYAVKIGTQRHEEAVKRKLPDKHGFSGPGGLTIHIEGAAGELAVAEALQIPWDATVNTFKSVADLSKNLEVRTASKSTYRLIVRPDDKDDRIFILALRLAPTKFRVVGWLPAHEAKKPEWLKDYNGRPPAYFVPQDKLSPIDTLELNNVQ